MTHTPGPWVVSDTNDEGDVYVSQTAKAGLYVAIALDPLYSSEPTTEANANANLIAAAPDLLEACERIAELDCTDGYTLADSEYPALWDALHVARAAIAKARGES